MPRAMRPARSTPGNLRLNISGGVAGSMTVAFSAASQTVSITLATSEVPVKAMHFDFKRS